MRLFKPSGGDDDLRAEIEGHLEQRTADLMSGGVSAQEARAQAVREFGNPALILERSRDVWRWVAFEDFVQDLRYGSRLLGKSPGFTAVAVLCLALGMGATTTMFSLIYAILLRPLPYRDPQQLVAIWNSPLRNAETKVFAQYSDFENFRDHARNFSDFAAVTWALDGRTMTGPGNPRKVLVIPATEGLFRLLGVQPLWGRTFQPSDVSGGCQVVLAHRFWQGALAGDPNAVGHQIRFDDQSCTVLGIMPREFAFFPEPTGAWSLIRPDNSNDQQLLKAGVGIFARLNPEATGKAATDELKALAAAREGGIRYGVRMQPVVRPLQGEFTWLAGRSLRTSLLLLFAAVTAVLLIACFNVASLLLGRSVAREREMVLRAALGSGRGRLVRQLLTESLLLAMVSAGIGTALAFAAVHCFRMLRPVELPVGSIISVNVPVLAFAASVAACTAALFGLAPAWRTSGVSLHAALQSGSRALPKSRRLSGGLVAAELAFSLPLLVGAGLLIQSIQEFAAAPLGFDPNHLVRLPVSAPPSLQPAERLAFYRQLLADAEATIGSPQASLSTAVPIRGGSGSSVLVVEGRQAPAPDNALTEVAQQAVSEGYFGCLGIPVRSGRDFTTQDRPDTQAVAIINRELARKYFPEQDPQGKRIKILGDAEWLTIIGVVDDEKRSTPFQEMGWISPPLVYRPIAQRIPESANLLFRQDSGSLVQSRLQQRHPAALIGEPEHVSTLVDHYLKYPRFRAVLTTVFAFLALILAAAGVYGVLSHLVAQRSREIGIRMALGAQRRSVVAMIVKDGMLITFPGTAAGLLLTWWTSRFLANLLYGVKALDPASVGAVVVLLLSSSLLAMYIPARRAATLDPMAVLKEE